ncbi:hypothetical protein [Helicobacter pylori]|nr:hypothetical protein [Helicobacter pylori]WQX59316.1 hypothetical protein KVJ99_07655 [Helicobacter pylori]
MKIKAIMLGLVFSGGLLLANSSQGLNNSDAIQQYIDTLLKRMMKTYTR